MGYLYFMGFVAFLGLIISFIYYGFAITIKSIIGGILIGVMTSGLLGFIAMKTDCGSPYPGLCGYVVFIYSVPVFIIIGFLFTLRQTREKHTDYEKEKVEHKAKVKRE